MECIFIAKYIQLLNAVKRVLSYISFEVLMSHEGTMCGWFIDILHCHCSDVIMSAIASPIPASRLFTQPFIQGADQRKHQSSALLAFVRGIHRWPANYPHKEPVTRKMFPFDDVIMVVSIQRVILLFLPVEWSRRMWGNLTGTWSLSRYKDRVSRYGISFINIRRHETVLSL